MLREFWVGEAEVFVDLEMENNMEKNHGIGICWLQVGELTD